MKMDKPTQSMSTRRRGDDLTASTINQLMAKIRASIVGGKGILIRRSGDQVIIEVARVGRAGAGGGGGMITADSKAELPDPSTVPETSMARVIGTSDPDRGSVYVVSPLRNAWTSINFWE